MKQDVTLDLSRLLGYRLALAGEDSERSDERVSASSAVKKLGSKIGDKPGIKDGPSIQARVGHKIGTKGDP